MAKYRHTVFLVFGWDERTFAQVVKRPLEKGIIEKVNVSMGRGRPPTLYQPKGKRPSVKHQFYVYWLLKRLTSNGLVCLAESVGPDIQIPSMKTAIDWQVPNREERCDGPGELR
jgi:hypothetical protein